MFERYTEHARRVLFFARYESSQLGSLTIESEHLLLGLLRETKGTAGRILSRLPGDSIRHELTQHYAGREKIPTSVEIPFSEESKRCLRHAAEEADLLGHSHIGTEHLLLGLLRVDSSVSARVLIAHRIDLAGARQQVAAGRARGDDAPAQQVLDAIGNTPLVGLRHVVPAGAARVVIKLESANPTGSMKDRMARSLVERAAADGRLVPGGTVVEYTAGTTGISLAFVCAALGYRSHFVFSDAFSDEKRLAMLAYGAQITDVPSDGKRITKELIEAMIARAGEISLAPGHWWCDQLKNHDGAAGYLALGEELWRQAGHVDAFVQCVSTAHSIHGVARSLRRKNPTLQVIGVEPAESAVLSGNAPGSHRIEGIGIGFVPPLWNANEVNEVLTVSTADAIAMARRLAREEAIFAGTSTGANVVAALRVAARLGSDATVATIAVDSGLRYLSTDVFR